MASRFYVTTPIYYVSDVPHLGHAYTTIVADTLARYHRLRGRPTRFLTGTDEHGQKIARMAEAAKVTPRAYADKFAEAYRATWTALEISNDDFIRTTDPDHEATVQDLWRAMDANGAIYEGEYEGWYCVPCEQFYTEKELNPGNACPVHLKPVEKVKEKSFYFRLSKYAQPLLEHYEKHPEFILPEMRRNEVAQFVRQGLQDLSISRTTFAWGVPVPEHKGHIIYVWLDALCNYYSASRRSDEAKKFWDDPDSQIVHLVGKEISRFHAVYWPAFLMAAGWPLPKTIFAHGWWTVDGEKMSKTRGNVVDPLKLSNDVGVDAFRYFVLREVPLGADGDFSHEAFLTRYNAELANDLGNLLNRTLGMIEKYGFKALDRPDPTPPFALADETAKAVAEAMERFEPSIALQSIWNLVRAANTFVDQRAPWKAIGDRQEILWMLLEMLRVLAHLVEPFLPDRADEMRRQLGVSDEKPHWPRFGERTRFQPEKGAPLFPRIDDERRAELLAKWMPKSEAAAKESDSNRVIDFEEFQRLDLRVGEITSAEPIPKAKKLYKLAVDLGGEQRQVVAGIAEAYRPDELVGKKVIVVANLKPATIRGVTSEGMILAAGEEQILALSGLDRDAPPGTKVR
jgi:methionyl-tRNA synthetase